MRVIGIAILIAFGGTLAAAIYTFVLGLAGAPGAFLTAFAGKRSQDTPIPYWGIALTLAGQLYASMAFAAFVVLSIRSLLTDASGWTTWLAWAVAWWVAGAPALFALKDAAAAETKTVQHVASTFTAPLTLLGFWVFVLVPSSIEWAWGWLPRF